jgi:GNAT superfamily N-acetyltransferase
VGVATVIARIASGPSFVVPRRYVEIDNMAVKPSSQRKGIGRALVDAADKWARTKDITKLTLKVYEFNHNAQAFYRAMGFVTAYRSMTRQISN